MAAKQEALLSVCLGNSRAGGLTSAVNWAKGLHRVAASRYWCTARTSTVASTSRRSASRCKSVSAVYLGMPAVVAAARA